MMLLLLPHIPVPTSLGALLAWRVVYYLFPLIVALGFFAIELLHAEGGITTSMVLDAIDKMSLTVIHESHQFLPVSTDSA